MHVVPVELALRSPAIGANALTGGIGFMALPDADAATSAELDEPYA